MSDKQKRAKNADAVGIRKMRLESGLKREHAAKRLGISGGQLGMYESGRSEPSPTRICRMAALYGAAPEEVFKAVLETIDSMNKIAEHEQNGMDHK